MANRVTENLDFDSITLKLASPERIVEWSHGEVIKPETINYRSLRPERDGLFCEKIFGPTKDYECYCGKYKLKKYEGVVCERCGVTVTSSDVRRKWMGHITLAVPAAHIWFLKSIPSQLSLVLNLKNPDLQKVVYYENYIVTDSGDTPLKKKMILTEEAYHQQKELYNAAGKDFTAEMGAGAVMSLLKEISIEEEIIKLKLLLDKTGSKTQRLSITKRLQLFLGLKQSGVRPEWMIMTVVPVIPPDLRPLVPLDGGRFATADLNSLYRRLIHRNNRLKKLTQMNAPEIILRNEKRMLQEAVDALLDNSRKERRVLGTGNRPLKSLTDNLKGKKGRFRQNLLGKRLDYSGRSVIVVGPHLHLSQCGLPKEMALELFKLFVINKLQQNNPSRNMKSIKRMIENQEPEVWDMLELVVKDHPILLNRAPTLHRLGMQAFYPVLIEGRAIQLHPLACAAFNADFDGDQMAVHVPLSTEAQLEARTIMLSTNNLLAPASGNPIVQPSQDMILGCYFLTAEKEGEPNDGKLFYSEQDVKLALEFKKISLHTRIKVLINDKVIDTTAGRIIFLDIISDDLGGYKESLHSQTLTKKKLSEIIQKTYRVLGQQETITLVDRIKEIGFRYATLSGLSFSVSDLTIPRDKKKIIKKATKLVKSYEDNYKKGLITAKERRVKAIDVWANTMDNLTELMLKEMQMSVEDKDYGNKFNPVYIMAQSGARGSTEQIKQLAAMRGPMARHTGEIIETPIIANFREGLNVLEYFISIHGARKGLVDTALKTSQAGYLTRRLVDVAHSVIISEDDCGTNRGIIVKSFKEYDKDFSYREKLYGRVAAEDIIIPGLGNVILKANEMITHEVIDIIEDAGINFVKVRSPLTCESKHGVCRKCYGLDMARDKMVELGEAVGVIAAQSIGEPGTQLTLRTFHIGGTARQEKTKDNEVAPTDGIVYLENIKTVVNREGQRIVTNNNAYVKFVIRQDEYTNIEIPYGSKLMVEDEQKVAKGAVICQWDPLVEPTIVTREGIIEFEDLVDDKTLSKRFDPIKNEQIYNAVEYLGSDLNPKIIVVNKDNPKDRAPYRIEPNSTIIVRPGDEVKIGDILTEAPREKVSSDITLGLPRIKRFVDLQNENWAVVSDIDGIVRIVFKEEGHRTIEVKVINEEADVSKTHRISGQKILVHDGQYIRKGERITEGDVNPRDLIRIKGEIAAQTYTVNQIQQVYRGQGITLNNKHIEIMLRQMTRRLKITDPGDTEFLEGTKVHKVKFNEVNERVIAAGGKPAAGIPMISGIIEESLAYESILSAASFQATTKVLTRAILRGATDHLRGLKENIIMGHLLPVGTGAPEYQDAVDVEFTDKYEPAPLI